MTGARRRRSSRAEEGEAMEADDAEAPEEAASEGGAGDDDGGEEEENEEEDSEGEDDEETSSEEEEVGIALQLPARSTRGCSYQRLVGDALRNDQEFWNHSTWEEEDDDDYNCSEGEEAYKDIIDSDFDAPEEEGSSDEEGETGKKKRDDGEKRARRGEAGDIVEDDDERARKRQKRNAFQDLWKKKQQQQKRQEEAKKRKKDAGRVGRDKQRRGRERASPGRRGRRGGDDEPSEGEFPQESSGGEKGERGQAEGRKRGEEAAKEKRRRKEGEGEAEDGGSETSRRRTRDSTRQHTQCVARRLEEEEMHRRKKERKKRASAKGAGGEKEKQGGCSAFREPTLEEHLAEAKITEARNVASLMVIEEKEEARKLRYVDVKKNIYKGDFDSYISWASWLVVGDLPPSEEEEHHAPAGATAAEEANRSPPSPGACSPGEQTLAGAEDAPDKAAPSPKAGEAPHVRREAGESPEGGSQSASEAHRHTEKRTENGRGDWGPAAGSGVSEAGPASEALQKSARPREETADSGSSGRKTEGESEGGRREHGRTEAAEGEKEGKDDDAEANFDDYAMEMRMFTDGKFPDIYHQQPLPERQVHICPVSGLEAKYLDPLTGVRYATTHAFKCVREAYHRLREQQLFQALAQAKQMLDVKAEELGGGDAAGACAVTARASTSVAAKPEVPAPRAVSAQHAHRTSAGGGASAHSRRANSFAGVTAGDVWVPEPAESKRGGRSRRGAKSTARGGRGRKAKAEKPETHAFLVAL
ncbi:YL1 nuclear protein C-terminal domain-containing protein [Besnoitia besnoiti]|uniref:YL1 nuclear protein C-terminal domain-containing protein n=1 Tax=Besnoitia besnoiti TaxID=94643 RepID=A0A2A9MEA2_BESBE|nr:YL1 nuclear protein C-terminal domain-containing protein [Besnoitia besnoiti]PFH34276.1 YL1 nuclear protein C-terminal domain-containing protein [Besnoitia besnoiti]